MNLMARCACAALLTCLGFTAMAAEKAVHLRGTEALVPTAQYMAEAYMREHPGATIVVSGGGTFRGYKALLDGSADIAMATGGAQDNVNDLFTKDSPKTAKTVVGYTAVIPVVHPQNALHNVSLEQLRDVFSGRIKNWKDLGGKDAPIVLLIGPPTEDLTATVKEKVLGELYSFSPKRRVTEAADRVRHVEGDAHAITFVAFGDLNPRVKPLSIAGHKPSADNVRNGAYPLGVPLILVSTTAAPQETQRFIRYFSTPGNIERVRAIISKEALDR